jgi:type II secretory pathway pseudopilin PulG
MIEILVVVGIIALLVGLLIPAVTMVQKTAKDVKQKAQFTAIDLGLAAFRNDYGDYPSSFWWSPSVSSGPQNYCGSQKLAEALLGWDLMGFHPNSAWRADGLDSLGGLTTYHPPTPDAKSLSERRSRYIELDTANAFRLGESSPGARDGLFVDTAPLTRSTYVLCDVFEVPQRKLQLADGKSITPGTPILYYRANTTSKTIAAGVDPDNRIYNWRDNVALISLGRLADWAKPVASRRAHPIAAGTTDPYFYDYIRDPKVMVQNLPWPYRPDSYILISAGADGLYGTPDDIRNFGKK